MKVVLYARYSPGSSQNDQSIEGQLKVCREYAERNNYNIIYEYIDRATTGTSDNRPQFLKMIEDSSKKNFEGILVYQLDRFARNRYDSATYKSKLKKNGVRVLSARENISDDASGILMESVLEGMAEYFSVELGQKVKRGMGINAEKCYYNGGTVPLGFKLIEAERLATVGSKEKIKYKYAIDNKTAPIVRKVFEMYIKGDTITEIVKYLNNQQVKTSKGNKFNANSINRMLNDKKYIGIYSYGSIEIIDGIPRIISDDIFNEVKEKMIINKKAPARAKATNEYLLTTKLFCGHCKDIMRGESGTGKAGKFYTYYKCKNVKIKPATCNKKSVPKEYIENLVVEEARKILTDENIMIIAKSVVEVAEKEMNTSNLKRLNKLLNDKVKQKSNLIDSLKICDIDSVKKSIFEEMAKMDNELKDIENQIADEEIEFVKLTIPQVKFFLTQLKKGDVNDEKYRKALINVLINKIYLYDDRFTIIFNTQDKDITIDISLITDIECSYLIANGSPI